MSFNWKQKYAAVSCKNYHEYIYNVDLSLIDIHGISDQYGKEPIIDILRHCLLGAQVTTIYVITMKKLQNPDESRSVSIKNLRQTVNAFIQGTPYFNSALRAVWSKFVCQVLFASFYIFKNTILVWVILRGKSPVPDLSLPTFNLIHHQVTVDKGLY